MRLIGEGPKGGIHTYQTFMAHLPDEVKYSSSPYGSLVVDVRKCSHWKNCLFHGSPHYCKTCHLLAKNPSKIMYHYCLPQIVMSLVQYYTDLHVTKVQDMKHNGPHTIKTTIAGLIIFFFIYFSNLKTENKK